MKDLKTYCNQEARNQDELTPFLGNNRLDVDCLIRLGMLIRGPVL